MTGPPLTFQPVLKRLIWGGRKLGTVLHKPIGPEHDYAESWEIADHRHGQSIVAAGPFTGQTLNELVRRLGPDLMGPDHGRLDQFPLLFKFIDARDVLSVQVHPDDAHSQRLANDNGKTEAWVVLDAEPNALIYAGLRSGVDRRSFQAALEAGRVEETLHRFPARTGDCIFIPAGTIHAIGAGVLMAEIQQMSDATFRVHDWGRLGTDGRPRELHVAQALEVIDFNTGPVAPVEPRTIEGSSNGGGYVESLVRCPYFQLDRFILPMGSQVQVGQPSTPLIMSAIDGTAHFVSEENEEPLLLSLGQTALLPAGLVGSLRTQHESAKLLICSLPT